MSRNINRKLSAALIALAFMGCVEAQAASNVTIIPSKYHHSIAPMPKIISLVKTHFAIDKFREVKAQLIYNEKMQIDHIIVYLFSKKYHRVDFGRITVNENLEVISVKNDYKLSKADYTQQPGIKASDAKCPDPAIEFIAFAPNDWDFEQKITVGVAKSAEAHSLKTVRLLIGKATRQNYLNYMTCPKLVGNFYDGDSNPEVIETVDGVITYGDIDTVLRNHFRYKVTNIWLACQAYNDPIKTSMLDIAQSQKYAAGISDLIVGPSDKAAACTMKRAMDGKPMTAAFNSCYLKYDTKEDIWGFGGMGSDIFGT